MKTLVLGRKVKRVVLLDDEDFDRITEHPWYTFKSTTKYYAMRIIYENRRYAKCILMHREVLNLPEYSGYNMVDHIDGNGLNNCKHNLRVCSRSENLRNSCKRRDNKSGFKGVHWDKNRNKWRAQIRANSKKRHLGVFDTPEEAYAAYCKAGRELHGTFFNDGEVKKRRKKKKIVE